MERSPTALEREMTLVIMFAVCIVARHTRLSKEEIGKYQQNDNSMYNRGLGSRLHDCMASLHSMMN